MTVTVYCSTQPGLGISCPSSKDIELDAVGRKFEPMEPYHHTAGCVCTGCALGDVTRTFVVFKAPLWLGPASVPFTILARKRTRSPTDSKFEPCAAMCTLQLVGRALSHMRTR